MTSVFIGTMQKLREIYTQETTMSGSLPSSLGSTNCENPLYFYVLINVDILGNLDNLISLLLYANSFHGTFPSFISTMILPITHIENGC